MNFRQKQSYGVAKAATVEPVDPGCINVYFRNEDGTLGKMEASKAACETYKEARMLVKEALVAEGGILGKQAILAVIDGGAV